MSTPLASGWEVKFKLACLERRGDGYQDFFARIMERRDLGFQRVRPWGNVGDRKNDGWSPSRRTLFQCYAPNSFSASQLTDKLEEDYVGAIGFWKQYFDSWVFVHNDIDGLAPSAAIKIAELDARSKDVACAAWGYIELREEFACLSDSDREAILGPALTPLDFLGVDAAGLKPLIGHLKVAAVDPSAEVRPVPADKIDANELEPSQIDFLKVGAGRAPLVDEYLSLSLRMPNHADGIAQAVRSRYDDFRAEGLSPAITFDAMVSWLGGVSGDSESLANAFAVIAYFFERCHIFEPTLISP